MHHHHYGDEYGVDIGELIAWRGLEIEGEPNRELKRKF